MSKRFGPLRFRGSTQEKSPSKISASLMEQAEMILELGTYETLHPQPDFVQGITVV